MKKLISILAIVLFILFTQGCPSTTDPSDKEPRGYVSGNFSPIIKDDINNTYVLWDEKENLYKITPTLIKTDKIYSDLISIKVDKYLTYSYYLNVENTFYKMDYLYRPKLDEYKNSITKNGKIIFVDDLIRDYYNSKIDLNKLKKYDDEEFGWFSLYPEGLYVIIYKHNQGIDFEDIKHTRMASSSAPSKGYSKAYYRFYPVDGNGSRYKDTILPYTSEFARDR